MKRRLVILTTHFGTNFSGGSTATCEIFSRIENSFSEIIVIGTQLGRHPFDTLQFIQFRNWLHAVNLIKGFNKPNTTFYGDFYNSILYVLAKVPFNFTYHDNWPELKRMSFSHWFKGLFYWSIYKQLFKRASAVVTVSEFRRKTIFPFNPSVRLIRNGVSVVGQQDKSKRSKTSLLMAGNIDDRKYKYAVDLFQILDANGVTLSVDIYGHVIDDRIAQKLRSFPFVKLMGFAENIPYGNYLALIHTSMMENLSLVTCEALLSKLPVIAFGVGGLPEVINSTNGFLIKDHCVSDMAKIIDELISSSLSLSFEENPAESYSWDIAAKRYAELLVI